MIHSIIGFNLNKEIRFYRSFSEKYSPSFILSKYNKNEEVLIRHCIDCNIIYHKYSTLIIGIVADKYENVLFMSSVIMRMVHGLNILLNKVCEIDMLYSLDKVYMVLDGLICDGKVVEVEPRKIAMFGRL